MTSCWSVMSVWVRTREISLVRTIYFSHLFDKIHKHLIALHDFAGISHYNIEFGVNIYFVRESLVNSESRLKEAPWRPIIRLWYLIKSICIRYRNRWRSLFVTTSYNSDISIYGVVVIVNIYVTDLSAGDSQWSSRTETHVGGQLLCHIDGYRWIQVLYI